MIRVLLLGLVYTLLLLVLLLFLFWRLWFCRKPRRVIPEGPRLIVSPANGTVAVVERYDATRSGARVTAEKWNAGSVEILAKEVAKKGWFLLIVMTPLNVHYQRAPVTGRVLATRHTRGSFHNAVKDPGKLLTLENERNELLIETRVPSAKSISRTIDGEETVRRVKVVQIAGVLARRISCFAERNQKIEKGEPIGFINLGSQVAVLLPEDAAVTVEPGDVVIDGETVIAAWR